MVIWLAPKTELYYFAERQLSPLFVTIHDEKVDDSALSLKVSDATIYYQDLVALTFTQFTLTSALFFNRVDVRDIRVGEDLKSFLPPKIAFINARHTLLDPTHIILSGEGDFGSFGGTVDLMTTIGFI